MTAVKTDAFTFELVCGEELKALRWRNHQAGAVLDLGGGAELEVEVDAARDRVWIEGWHTQKGDKEAAPPDLESGFKAGYHRPDYPDIREHRADDARWRPACGLCDLTASGEEVHWQWARTRIFLPESLRGEPLTFTLGGFGVGDFRHTRVFLNGGLLGEREAGGRWFEPGTYLLRPDDPLYDTLRFGQVNILALQLGGAICRNLRLDEVDPAGAYHWPYPHIVQPAYFQHVEAGEKPVRKLTFRVESVVAPDDGALRVVLAAREEALRAELHYRTADDGRTLVKSVTLTNTGDRAVRVMNVGLGDYRTGAPVSEGDMGFPVYAGGAFFFALAHPAGWVMGEAGRVRLRQFPGVLLEPGRSFACMEAVLGVSAAGRAREAFLGHLTPRTRRVRRGHDRPYGVVSMFGGWPISPDLMLEDELSEETCLRYGDWLRAFRDKTGETFDLVSVDFWQDPTADLVKFNRKFPQGFDTARRALTETGAHHGLWIDSSVFAKWHVGHNPLVQDCLAGELSYAARDFDKDWGYAPLCRAAEPIRSIFQNAFLHHVAHGARLLKFDNLVSTCHSRQHGHWPGVYSTGAIYDSVAGFFAALDRACPEVFLMLYWGYRSPWWLLHGDTQFECGLKIEASSPSPAPSLYARDGVTVTLDQATAYSSDLPKLGKDSLGVWLSRWPWNSSIGTERWREGVIMDLCRGNLLFQPWMGEDALAEEELADMAEFLRLLRARPECFRHPRPVLGDPWKNEPYGYACSDGQRAFVAVNNFGWGDYAVHFGDPSVFGLDPRSPVVVFRHYPAPGRIAGADDCLRPFEVALYELVPAGGEPSGSRSLGAVPAVKAFAEPTAAVPVVARTVAAGIGKEEKTVATAGVYDAIRESTANWRGFAVAGTVPLSSGGGTLVLCALATRAGKAAPTPSIGGFFKAGGTVDGKPAELTPVLAAKTYPATWQAWRVGVPPSTASRPFEIVLATRLPEDVAIEFRGHFIPDGAPAAGSP